MGLYLKFTQPMRVCGLSGKSKALHATPYFVDSCTLFGVAMQYQQNQYNLQQCPYRPAELG